MTPARRRKATIRLRERTLAEWGVVIDRIAASAFCRGENERGWVATFDWLLQPDTATKVLEGKYDGTRGSSEPAWRPPTRRRPWCRHVPKCGSLGWHNLRISKGELEPDDDAGVPT